MHTGSLKTWALALTFWLALHTSSLRAQIFTNDLPLQAVTTGSNPVDFEFRSDGTLIAKGNYGVGSLLSGDQGAGTRLLWFPELAAFRAGYVDGSEWNSSNIGQYSVAFGHNTTASGPYSTALGEGSSATGTASTAMGKAYATGTYSTAIGGATASGTYSLAIGGSYAGGYSSMATGSSYASGDNSTAMGNGTASGYGALAFAYGIAVGHYSMAFGLSTTASGYASTASGLYTTAAASLSFAIGTYNVGGGNATTWVPTDPLFEIGNGTSTTASDALVVYKNGNAILQGTLQVAPGGDIPMYTGE